VDLSHPKEQRVNAPPFACHLALNA